MHKRMRMFRLRANMTLDELSKRSGVSASTIQHWEQGSGLTTIVNIVSVCDVLGISIDEYIGRGTPEAVKMFIEELNQILDLSEKIHRICEKTKGQNHEKM